MKKRGNEDMKKIISRFISVGILGGIFMLLTSCGSGNSEFNSSKTINAITREEGSGTRGAFVELLELEEKLSDGTKRDLISKEITVENNTNTILTTVQNDLYALGYISMGSLNESVTAVQIDGVDANAANIKNGTYKVSRPFNIAVKGETDELTKDFLNFIMSQEGQEVVANSYIKIDESAKSYASEKPNGKITVGGSSSVAPLMEKLIEAYKEINPNGNIELQTSDSSIGMTKTIEGAYDIGMASRELKDNEKSELTEMKIALDGIAVIVNKENTITNLSKEDIKNIYLGEAETWSEITQ